MRLWRDYLATLVAVVLTHFLAVVAAPQCGILVHQHAGGDHAHVHGDDGEELEHHAHLPHARHHQEQAPDHPPIAAHAAGYEEPDPDSLLHWHAQHPFHRTLAAAMAVVGCVFTVTTFSHRVLPAPPAQQPLSTHARAPPVSLLT